MRLLRPIQQQGQAALTVAAMYAQTAFQWDADHPLRRALAFLRVEGQTGRQARPARNAGWNLGTANGSAVTVPGGTVNVYEEVTDARGGRTDHFALQYKGLDADTTGWLQFVTVEAEAFNAGTGGDGKFESGTMTGAGQPETLTYGRPASPDWHLDARSDILPFYESPDATGRGAGTRDHRVPGEPDRGGTDHDDRQAPAGSGDRQESMGKPRAPGRAARPLPPVPGPRPGRAVRERPRRPGHVLESPRPAGPQEHRGRARPGGQAAAGPSPGADPRRSSTTSLTDRRPARGVVAAAALPVAAA